MELKSYEDAEYLVLATRGGMVKKSRLSDYDTNRTAGLIAINLREGDEVVSAFTVSAADDILLVSRNGMSLRFHADDASLRPMGRSTSGVTGMKFRDGDELISANVVTEGSYVFVVTEGATRSVRVWMSIAFRVVMVLALRLLSLWRIVAPWWVALSWMKRTRSWS